MKSLDALRYYDDHLALMTSDLGWPSNHSCVHLGISGNRELPFRQNAKQVVWPLIKGYYSNLTG